MFIFINNTLPQTSRLISDIHNEYKDKDGFLYANGFTWSVNPVAFAAAMASWDIFEKENVCCHVK